MKVGIRVDASAQIGSGHLMRCLCLADQLKAGGGQVTFVGRLPAHLSDLVARHGHRVAALDACVAGVADDAAEAWAAAPGSDWFIVDHYGLGSDWERAVRAKGARVLAIDDLERDHDCDAVLDQNHQAAPDHRYADRVPAQCERLLGPSFALLRAEFALARHEARPRDGRVRRLLVFLGGMDADNVTSMVLRAVAAVDRDDLAVDVVVGATHPRLEEVSSLTAALRHGVCHVQTNEMARLLAAADLAIGAGGSATWERCALGVPTLGLCLAENQLNVLRRGSREGFVYFPEPADAAMDDAGLAVHLKALMDNPGLRHHLSATGMALVDGRGAGRVAARLLAPPPVLVREATARDCDELRRWRNAPAVRAVSRNTGEISEADHRQWFDAVLASPSRHLLIGERAGRPVGVVRFDAASDPAEISIYLTPDHMGRGDGAALLASAEAWLRREQPAVTRVMAHVNAGNTASHRLFERGGYELHSTQYLKRIHS